MSGIQPIQHQFFVGFVFGLRNIVVIENRPKSWSYIKKNEAVEYQAYQPGLEQVTINFGPSLQVIRGDLRLLLLVLEAIDQVACVDVHEQNTYYTQDWVHYLAEPELQVDDEVPYNLVCEIEVLLELAFREKDWLNPPVHYPVEVKEVS